MKARPGLKILEIDKQNITMANNYRIFVEKYPEFQVEAASLRAELNENLQLDLKSLRLLNVYDLFGFTPELLEKSRYSVFGEIVTDNVTDECDLTGSTSQSSSSRDSSTRGPLPLLTVCILLTLRQMCISKVPN